MQKIQNNEEEKKMAKSISEMKIVNFGDSIFGKCRPPFDISTFISEITGAKTYNVAFGGCRMSEHTLKHFDRFSMYRLADAIVDRDFTLQDESFSYEPIGEALPDYFPEGLATLKGIDFSDVDIITIAYGTNDFTAGRKLEGADRYDVTSFAGALRYSVEKISKAYPHISIVLCSQTYRFWRENGVAVSDSNTRVIKENKLTDYVRKTEEVAKEYGLFYIDNYNGKVINEGNRDICFSDTDGTHPIVPGLKLIAENVSRELVERFGK